MEADAFSDANAERADFGGNVNWAGTVFRAGQVYPDTDGGIIFKCGYFQLFESRDNNVFQSPNISTNG